MKKIKLLLMVIAVVLTVNTFGQSPEKINYQAIIRDASNLVVANQNVSIKIEILQSTPSGVSVYEEDHNVVTNDYGLVNLKIGTGSIVSGTISAIQWGTNPYFLKISVDPAGGTNYTLVGISELVSVPYALHAKTVEFNDDADADPTNEYNTGANLTGTDLNIIDAGGTITVDLSPLQDGVNDADADPTNEIQAVSQTGNLVTLSNGGGTFNVNDADADPTNEYVIGANLTGTNLNIIDGGGTTTVDLSSLQDGVNDADADPTNEYNTGANLTGTDLNIIDGGGTLTVDLSSLQDGVNDADADPTNEYNTGANLTGTNLNIVDGGGTTTVDLSSLQDGVNDADADPTNEYNTGANLMGTDLNITDGGGTITVDLSPLVGGGDPSSTNELNTGANLTGTDLNIIDAGGTLTVDLSSLQDGVNDADADPTNEYNTGANLTGTDLNIIDGGGTLTVDLSPLVGGGDPSSTNELNTGANLTGTDLNIIDAGGTLTVDLSSLQDGVNDADADPTNEIQTLSIAGNQLSISGGNTVTIPVQTLFVGMHYQGGIIVFIDSSGQSGLIAALNDLPGTYPFQPTGNTNVPSAQSYYDGVANTTALVPIMGVGSAAEACDSYTAGGYSDWYLPSQAEIQLVFQNAYVMQNLDLGAIYWTSTQTPGGFGFSAVSYYGSGSANGSTNPNTAYTVRPMRAF